MPRSCTPTGYTDSALDLVGRPDSCLEHRPRTRRPAQADSLDKPAKAKRNSRDVFVYFDNDIKVKALLDATRLATILR